MSTKRGVCNCGVNFRKYPHDQRLCAPDLSTRLQKYARYLKERFPNRQISNLSESTKTQGLSVLVTPFTGPLHAYYNCVVCARPASPCAALNRVRNRDMSLTAILCTSCYARFGRLDPVFCFYYMKEGYEHCIRPAAKMMSLCLLRLGVPKDVRILIRRRVFSISWFCIHDQYKSE